MPSDPVALPELFVPGVLKRVRHAVDELQRQICPQPAAGRHPRKEERDQREHDAAHAVVEAEMHGGESLIPDGRHLLAHEEVAGEVEARLGRQPGQGDEEKQCGEHEPKWVAARTTW